MPSNQLLYLLYGDKAIYRREAKFSILCALQQRKVADSFSITLMTDSPEQFAGWPVTVIALDEKTIADWKGVKGYTHRIKACAIEAGMQLAEKTIFVDTDTKFLSDPVALFDRVSDEQFLMDRFEWSWREAVERPEFAAFTRDVINNGQLPAELPNLYNSGICGLTRKNSPLLASAISLIDSWSVHGQSLFTIEQIAVSFMLAGKKVNLAHDKVNHYYAAKRYHHAMLNVFFDKHGEHYTAELLASSLEVPRIKPSPSALARLKLKFKLMSVDKDLNKVARFYLYGSALPDGPYMDACRGVWWLKAAETLRKSNPCPVKLKQLSVLWQGKNHNAQFQKLLEQSRQQGR